MRGLRWPGTLWTVALLAACQSPPPTLSAATPPRAEPAGPVVRPFDRAWFAPGLELDAYSEVDLAPVDSTRLEGPGSRERARALEAALAEAIRSYPGGHRLTLVWAPGPETLVVELALLGSARGAALEGRARDGATGRVVARFADREPGVTAGGAQAVGAWAEQLAEILQTGGAGLVQETGAFALRAWPEAGP